MPGTCPSLRMRAACAHDHRSVDGPVKEINVTVNKAKIMEEMNNGIF